jgi:hypothetical protein
MRRLDRFDSLRVITPCSVPWSSMEGDDDKRFCGKCRKNVYNVANMTRAEALDVIERSEGRVCMLLTRRADGRIVTGDCWAVLRRARRRGLWAFVAVLPVVLATQLWAQTVGLRGLSNLFGSSRAQRPVAGGAAMPAIDPSAVAPPFPLPIATPGEIGFAPEAPEPSRRRQIHRRRDITIKGEISPTLLEGLWQAQDE